MARQDGPEWHIGETWTRFLYPFLFTRGRAADTQSTGQIFMDQLVESPAHQDVWRSAPFEAREVDNMLPFVRQYLSPPEYQRFQMTDERRQPSAIFHFAAHQAPPLGFQISDIALHVFFNGVAILSLEVRPLPAGPDEPLTIQRVQRVNAHLASLASGAPFVLANEGPDAPAGSEGFHLRTFMAAERAATIRDLLSHLIDSFREDASPLSVAPSPMVDRFLPVYGAALLRPSRQHSIEVLDRKFYEFAQHHLTILRKTFPPNDISHFSQIHLGDNAHHYMPYHNVIHSQTLDGGFILAYDNGLPHFSGAPAPAMQSFRTSYFFMMLIPLHQRLSILRYTMASAAMVDVQPDRGADLRRLREAIYEFTTRCYFSQASMSEERNHIYQRWQQAFEVTRMYDELKEQVHDIDNYLADLERARQNDLQARAMRRGFQNMKLYGLITLVFLPLTILLYAIPAVPVVARWIDFRHEVARSVAILLAMSGFVCFLLFVMLRYLRRMESL